MLRFLNIILLASYLFTVDAENICITRRQEKQNGTCTSIFKCEALYRILIKKPITLADGMLLRRSQCGFENNTPYVCCPTNSTGDSNVWSSITDDSPLKPGVCGIQNDDISYFVWLALINYIKPDGEKSFRCGGVLIHKNYILTAAHCTNGTALTKSGYEIDSIRLGEYDITTDKDCVKDFCLDPVVDIRVDKVIPHERYLPESLNQYHDIALIRLSQSVKFGKFIRPICLPIEDILRIRSYSEAGWSILESPMSNVKRSRLLQGISRDECNEHYKRLNITIGQGQFCMYEHSGPDSVGDTGGPIMGMRSDDYLYWFYVSGIKSFGPITSESNELPNVYTHVQLYLNWIYNKIRQ